MDSDKYGSLRGHGDKRGRYYALMRSCVVLGIMVAAAGCEPPPKAVPVTWQTSGARIRYSMASFSIMVPDSWGPRIGKNQVGGILAEQRIQFETDRGRLLVRSYGGQSDDCVKDWTKDLVEPGMQQRSVIINGRPGSEFYGRNERWVFVHWNDRILVFYAELVDDQIEIARVIRSIRLH